MRRNPALFARFKMCHDSRKTFKLILSRELNEPTQLIQLTLCLIMELSSIPALVTSSHYFRSLPLRKALHMHVKICRFFLKTRKSCNEYLTLHCFPFFFLHTHISHHTKVSTNANANAAHL